MFLSNWRKALPKRSRKISHGRCAWCSAPLAFNAVGVVAWRLGKQFVCDEFCAGAFQTSV